MKKLFAALLLSAFTLGSFVAVAGPVHNMKQDTTKKSKMKKDTSKMKKDTVKKP